MSVGSQGPARHPSSLIERAAELYDFGTALRQLPVVEPEAPAPNAVHTTLSALEQVVARPAPQPGMVHMLNRETLRRDGFIDPDSPPTSLSEEFRIVKRQLLAQANAPGATARDRLVLVNSAHPGDGKTWISINLALSLSAERESEILLVDGDFGKPSVAAQMGLPDGPGFMDALADPTIDVADLILRTDMPSLSVLRAGRQINNDTEMLASDRTRAALDSLVEGHPRRIVLFDSPPALAASAASELARHVGMVLLVVRADRTSDVALRDAAHLLSACANIQAVLNGVKFSSSGRLFGAYYKKRGG